MNHQLSLSLEIGSPNPKYLKFESMVGFFLITPLMKSNKMYAHAAKRMTMSKTKIACKKMTMFIIKYLKYFLNHKDTNF